MDTSTLDTLRTALENRRDELHEELSRLDQDMRALGDEQELERGGLGNHLAEDGSNVMEQERILALSGDLRDLSRQVDAALERMDSGAFGNCLRCGKSINPERLDAIPYVAHCIDCQQAIEREHAIHGNRS